MIKADAVGDFANLQVALGYLMTRYSMTVSLQLQSCPGCAAKAVANHLALLLEHPETQASPALRSAYAGLRVDWDGLSEHHAQHQAMMQRMEQPQMALH